MLTNKNKTKRKRTHINIKMHIRSRENRKRKTEERNNRKEHKTIKKQPANMSSKVLEVREDEGEHTKQEGKTWQT